MASVVAAGFLLPLSLGMQGCPRGKADPVATVTAAPPPAGPPAWLDVAPIGKVALELRGALIPRGADALVPGGPGETTVHALKRDYASSALHHVDFASPAAPTLGPPLLFRGPTSEPARIGAYVVLAVLEAGRPPELCLVRGGSPPRVITRVKLAAPMLGPLAVSGDVVYLASAAGGEGMPEPSPPQLLAFRLDAGETDHPALLSLGAQPLPGPARAIAVVGRRLLVAVEASPPLRSAPLEADGRPGALAWSLDYRIVQKLATGEYAFEAAPRGLVAVGDGLALAGDPHTTYVAIRMEDPPRLSFVPGFNHSRGGGLLAVGLGAPAGAAAGAVAAVYRLKNQRLYADAVDAEGRPRPIVRWRLGLAGSGRALALVPGLLLVADESFGVYLFPR